MKRHIIIYGIFAVAILAGCNKALNLQPLDQLSDAAEWKTPNDFKLGANAFYAYERTFRNVMFDYPNDANQQQSHSDQRSDLFAVIGNLNPFSNGKNTLPQADNNYNTDYSRIHNINFMLGHAAEYSDQNAIKQYVAEAKFFRAYVYFDLLQTYGAVTLEPATFSVSSPELYAARNSRDQVADFIISDLNAAIPNLPLQSAISAADQGRLSQGAAQGFLSRVALYEGTWQKFRGNAARATSLLTIAAAAANNVITSAQYGLFQPAALGDSAQKYLFILENQKSNPAGITKAANTEYMLSNRYDQTIRQINLNVSFSAVQYLTKKFVNLYLCKDGLPIERSPLFQGYATMNSEYMNRDNRMRYNLMLPHGYYWTQTNSRVNWTDDATDRASAGYKNYDPTIGTGYRNQKWNIERNVPVNQEGYDFPVIRYAEVLLNYAEATFELNGSISDADLDRSINLVRQRVNKTMPKLSNTFVTTNGLDMRTEIRRERTIELYMEGFRMDDLKRWKTAETEMPQPLLGITWTGTEFATTWPGAGVIAKDGSGNLILESGRTWSEKNYLLPIPQTQINLNPNLGQNPGWQ